MPVTFVVVDDHKRVLVFKDELHDDTKEAVIDVPMKPVTKAVRYYPSLNEYLFGMRVQVSIAYTKEETERRAIEWNAARCQACVEGLVPAEECTAKEPGCPFNDPPPEENHDFMDPESPDFDPDAAAHDPDQQQRD